MELNVAILYDDMDGECGAAFKLSSDRTIDLLKKISLTDVKLLRLSPSNTNKNTISTQLSTINSQPFLVFAFCHGTEHSLQLEGCEVVSVSENYYLFSQAMICAFSCFTAGDLADVLLSHGLKCYIGYSTEARFPMSALETIDIEMAGVEVFLSGGTTGNLYSTVVTKYKKECDRLQQEDPILAGVIYQQYSNFTIKGDTNLRLQDFVII